MGNLVSFAWFIDAATTIAGFLTTQFVARDMYEWLPRWADKVASFAGRKLPPDIRDRMIEEWKAHLDDVPGKFSKLLLAFGFIFAARKIIAHRDRARFKARWGIRILNRIVGIVGSIFVSPAFAVMTAALKVSRLDHPPLFIASVVYPHGAKAREIRFRTMPGSSAPQQNKVERFVATTGLAHLPVIFSVAAGNVFLFGKED